MTDNLNTSTTRFRLDAALDALDAWAGSACDADKDALYDALTKGTIAGAGLVRISLLNQDVITLRHSTRTRSVPKAPK